MSAASDLNEDSMELDEDEHDASACLKLQDSFALDVSNEHSFFKTIAFASQTETNNNTQPTLATRNLNANASFDMSLLTSSARKTAPAAASGAQAQGDSSSSLLLSPPPLRTAASWDERDTSIQNKSARFLEDLEEFGDAIMPAKKKRGTPLRGDHQHEPQHLQPQPQPQQRAVPASPSVPHSQNHHKKGALPGCTGKLTPASARRHRAPLIRRSSPRPVRPPTTPRASLQQQYAEGGGEGASTSICTSALPTQRHRNVSRTPWRPASVAAKQQRQEPSMMEEEAAAAPAAAAAAATSTTRKPKRSMVSCTTAASSATLFETTIDSNDSVDTQDTSTNFRFTSFPASLPRIPPAGRHQNQQQQSNYNHGKRLAGVDDSHNTSLSSLHSEEDDEDDDDSTLAGTPVVRTRLDFNEALLTTTTTTTTAAGVDGRSSPLRITMKSRLLKDDGMEEGGEDPNGTLAGFCCGMHRVDVPTYFLLTFSRTHHFLRTFSFSLQKISTWMQ